MSTDLPLRFTLDFAYVRHRVRPHAHGHWHEPKGRARLSTSVEPFLRLSA